MAKKSIRLPKGMNEAIHSIVDQQKDAIFTGSLALYLQGITDTPPSDIDVIVPEHHLSFINEAAEYSDRSLLEEYTMGQYSSPQEETEAWLRYMRNKHMITGLPIFKYDHYSDDVGGRRHFFYDIEIITSNGYSEEDAFESGSVFDRSVNDLRRIMVEGFPVDFIPTDCNEYVKIKFNGRELKLKKADAILDAKRLLFEGSGREKYAQDFDKMHKKCVSRYPNSAYAKTNAKFARMVESGSYMKQNLADDRTKYAASKRPKAVKSNTSDKRQNLADDKVKTDFKPTAFKASDPGKFGKNVTSYKDFDKSARANQPIDGKHGMSHQGVSKAQHWGAGNAYQGSSSLDDTEAGGAEFGPGFAHNDATPTDGDGE